MSDKSDDVVYGCMSPLEGKDGVRVSHSCEELAVPDSSAVLILIPRWQSGNAVGC